MQTYYDGAHAIEFMSIDGSLYKNTWIGSGSTPDAIDSNSFYLVPRSKPTVPPPPVKTNTIEIPGANGDIDMTNIPLGYPVYGKRTGSWEFVVAEDISQRAWDEEYARLMAFFHGKQLYAFLKDDPLYYYKGRFAVDSFKSEDMYDTVSISYDLDPFKWNKFTTIEDWFWDPFDFWYGTIESKDKFVDIPLNFGSATLITYTQALIGNAPVQPTFIVSTPGYDEEHPDTTGGVTLSIHNTGTLSGVKTFQLNEGTSTNPLIEMVAPNQNSEVRLSFSDTKAEGTKISIGIRPGRL
jgi:hypothetical protein